MNSPQHSCRRYPWLTVALVTVALSAGLWLVFSNHPMPTPTNRREPATTGEIPTADQGVSAFGEAVATTVEATATRLEVASTGDK